MRMVNDIWISCRHCGWHAVWYSDEERPIACAKCRDASETERAARRALVEEQNRIYAERLADCHDVGVHIDATVRPSAITGFSLPGFEYGPEWDEKARRILDAAAQRRRVLDGSTAPAADP